MRPRTELALSGGVLLVLAILAAGLGTRHARRIDRDPRRSTYLAGPNGARAFAEALDALGLRVDRFRRPTAAAKDPDGTGGRTVFAVVGPSIPLSAREGRRLAALGLDLLLAGPGTGTAMACLGFRTAALTREGVLLRPGGVDDRPLPPVRAVLVDRAAGKAVERSRGTDREGVTCVAPDPIRLDTILASTAGEPVALRIAYERRAVTLVADDRLFQNRVLRRSAIGPLVLGMVAPRYQRIVVDEYHHGYDAGGSLWSAAVRWSMRSPWGWFVWQLAAVAVIALVASGVRFGPVRSAVRRRRRSPMEHVRALATALAAARGHDVAVRLIVQGLRRRLSRSGHPVRADLDAWLDALGGAVRSARGREALESMTSALRRPPNEDSVLAAAVAVEVLWEELKPS